MSTQKAVIHEAKDVAKFSTDVPLPELPGDNWLLVKTKAVALNPTDWKAIAARPAPGSIAGCDYAGIVEEVGKDVTDLKVGDRVAGFVRGGDANDKSNGAFAEHIKAKVGCHAKISDNLSFEDAATLGVGITTVGQGLFQSLGLPLPPNKVQEPTPILIYGGSTATGTLAIQYAKLVGCDVYATASPRNFDLLRKLGADHVFNYNDADVGAKIREASDDKLKLVFDCISEGGSFEIGAAAISSSGGHLSALLPPPQDFPRKDVKLSFTLGYTALGEDFSENFPANQADYEFGAKFWKISEGLLNSGKIRPHPVEVRKGLEGVIQGMQDMKDGKVSGVKLVWTIE
ncbi:chaperonin 10-like protein [Phaeosphaeria sp. MPI-PUGE-AT-0046c]|nr:chaperonin 10-like protein [Phaeosphaeria sp. MPI-PUGE-AT-0046c]